jgi:hypothetical protein
MGDGASSRSYSRPAGCDKNATVAFVDVLSTLVNKTFPQFVEAMCEGSPRVVAGIAWALTSSRVHAEPAARRARAKGVPKSALLDVIQAQKRALQRARAAECRLRARSRTRRPRCSGSIADVADARFDVGELVGRLQGKDPIARMHIINILARFNQPEVRERAAGPAEGPNKLVRAAALAALARWTARSTSPGLPLLRDVGNRRAEPRHRCRHPRAIRTRSSTCSRC